jgi:hypothetical protein
MESSQMQKTLILNAELQAEISHGSRKILILMELVKGTCFIDF